MTYRIRPAVCLSEEDLAFLKNLPSNGPGVSLAAKDRSRVADIYDAHIHKTGITAGWGVELFTLETKEKWPSGGRVTTVQAQRMVLGWLVADQTYYNNMDAEKAADYFFNSMTSRPSYQLLVSKAYEKI